jgi:hypothetical protein
MPLAGSIFITLALFGAWIFYTIKKKVVPSLILGTICLVYAAVFFFMTSNIRYGYYRNDTRVAFRLLLEKLEQGKNEDVIAALKYATDDSKEKNKSMGYEVIEKLNRKNANL